MIQLIIDAATPIVDATITNKSDTLEILSKVNEFYNSAWDKLLVFGAIIGIIVPSVISYYQKKALTANENGLETKLNQKTKELFSTLEKDLNAKFEKKILDFKAEIERKVEKINENANASIFHIQANNYFEKGWHLMAVRDFLYAIESYAMIDDHTNVKATLTGISSCFDNLKKEDIKHLENIDYVEIIKILDKVDKKNIGGAFSREIKGIKSKYYKIEEEADNKA